MSEIKIKGMKYFIHYLHDRNTWAVFDSRSRFVAEFETSHAAREYITAVLLKGKTK